jgi:hypothetical protein
MEQEMKERIAKALSRTWDAIGDDCLCDEDGKPDHNMTMTREEVAEVSADASFDVYHDDQEAHDTWRKLKYDDPLRKEIVKIAFPYGHYGW